MTDGARRLLVKHGAEPGAGAEEDNEDRGSFELGPHHLAASVRDDVLMFDFDVPDRETGKARAEAMLAVLVERVDGERTGDGEGLDVASLRRRRSGILGKRRITMGEYQKLALVQLVVLKTTLKAVMDLIDRSMERVEGWSDDEARRFVEKMRRVGGGSTRDEEDNDG